jgi:hypothetical protein
MMRSKNERANSNDTDGQKIDDLIDDFEFKVY